jgi:hypothetical protein
MAYARRDFAGGAAATTLNGSLTDVATSITITSSTGWPSGSNGPFYAVIDRGNAGEEKVLVTTRSGTTLQTVTRGVDGTSAAAHSSGVAIEHCSTAVDDDEANLAVAKTIGQASAVGQILVADAANSFAAVQTKTSGQILVGNGTTLASVAVSGDATLSAAGALTIANTAVTAAKIAAAVAGDGLTGGAGSALAVGAGSGITVNANDVQIADTGVTSAMLGVAKVRLRRAAAQSIDASAGAVAVSWDTEDSDTSGYITATSSTLTVPAGKGGWHLITFKVVKATASGTHALNIVAGGVTYASPSADATASNLELAFTAVCYLAAADTSVCNVSKNSAADNYTARLNVVNLGA